MTEFKPYPYQQAGIDWILEHPAAGLFWGMGTGKTATTLSALDILMGLGETRRALVIAPKRVAEDTWSRETAKWTNLAHIRLSKVMGTQAERIRALAADADVYIINRENTQWLCEWAEKNHTWFWDTVIIDELSSFKNNQAKRFKALRAFRGHIQRIIGLTGTPAPNGLPDLWAQIYLLDRGERLGRTISDYRHRYFKPDKTNGAIVYSYKILPGAEEAIYRKLDDICMSLKKEDVLQLPGQVYERIEVTLPPDTLKQYRQFEKDQVLQATGEDGQIVAANAAALMNKLLQFANGAIYDEERRVRTIHDAKLDALEELIEEAAGDAVLVFYNFQHDRDRILERIRDARILDTAQDIADWNAGRIRVAVAHPASVGHGLNLQDGGHIIIWFGLTWSLELYQQANERLNRPGQKSVCFIYHLVAKGTHDSRVLNALDRKNITQEGLIDALRADIGG